jgi:hypothetical protein
MHKDSPPRPLRPHDEAFLTRALALITLLVLFPTGLQADVILVADPFSITGAGNDTAINVNIPARQLGTLTGGSYTELVTSPSGYTNDAFIEKNSASMGVGDALQLRTFHSTTSSQCAFRYSTNFGPQVVGKKWRVSYRGNIQRNAAGITDTWLSLDLGDTVNHVGPNNASTDIGLLIRGNGGWNAWADNVAFATNGAATTLKSPDLYATTFSTTMTIDETVAPVSVSAVIVVGANTFNIGPWNITWENTARYLEMRQQNAGTTAAIAAAGTLVDGRVDDLTVSLVGDPLAPPIISAHVQPQTLWVGDSAILSVSVDSFLAPTYQWALDGNPISGATSANLSITTAALASGGSYAVTATNPNGSATSTANVTVIYPNRWQRAAEPLAIASKLTPLIFSEIQAQPYRRGDGKNGGFIELYNTNPWPEDLTGWRISGDVNFAFPSGTSIPAQGFLVIAAKPDDLYFIFGTTDVLGPWTGALTNGGGGVKLRRANDSIVLDAQWNDGPEWPAAADGAGHSLVLARPSYGQRDVRAWAASELLGGSPGYAESLPNSPQDHVLINELLAHSSTGVDFIELYNSSALSVDVSGCWLSDSDAALAKFQIPSGTILAPRGFVSIDQAQLGFALKAEGETIYFTNAAQSRVLDAVRYRGQMADTASGRTPDGEGLVRRLTSATPGASNASQARGPVVLNEIYFHPITNDSEDEWVELKNLTSNAVALEGWRLSDGISYTFPAGAAIPANGYLVVAKNPTRMLVNHPTLSPAIVLGPFSGTLSDGGEEIVLGQPITIAGPLTYFATVDEMIYSDKSRWSQWADGGGSSLELADARSTAQPLWLDSDETTKAPWTLVTATGLMDHPHTNALGIADRLDAFLLDAGEALLDEVEATPSGGANLVTNGGFESGIGSWLVQGTHILSVLENTGFAGGSSLRIVATGRGDPAPNRVRTPLTATIAVDTTATISARARWLRGSPEFMLRLKGGGVEAYSALTVPKNLGTPGTTNSRSVANAAPAITDVVHRPAMPVAGFPFRVFARIAEEDSLGTVNVNYRLDPSATIASVAMNDAGTAGDLLAGDGIHTATIPAQAAGALVAFTITANDNFAAAATFPPTGECSARVGDTLPVGAFGAYTMWINAATMTAWTNRPPKTNEPFPITLLHNTSRILYDTGAHFAVFGETSGSNPTATITGYEIDLPPGEKLFGENSVTLDWPVRDVTNQREQLMHWMLEQMNLPTLHRRDVHLTVNGVRRSSATVPIYHEAHQPGGAYLEANYPNDTAGRLLKTSRWDEFSDTGAVIAGPTNSLSPFTTTGGGYKTARYRWSWRMRSDNENDYTDFFNLVTAANTVGTGYVGAVNNVVDMDQWMRNFAFADMCAYWDTFGNTNAKNAYIYKPVTGRWQVFTNDLDVGIGADINASNPPAASPLFAAGIDPPVQRMYDTPAFIRSYWCALQKSLGTFFSGTAITNRVTQRYNGYIANGVAVTSPLVGSGPHNLSIPAWIDARVGYLQTQLDTVNATFAVDGPTSMVTTTSPLVITGTAPVAAKSITFNGIESPLTWTSTTAWSAMINVAPGTNPLVIRTFNDIGAQTGIATLDVTFTGTNAWPALRINEWLADNAALNFDQADGQSQDWFELYNPTADAVELTNWILSDSAPAAANFVIPAGYSIPANGHLIVWADNELVQNTGSGQLHVPFKLSTSGETLTLKAPDATVVDTVTFGQQLKNRSQGRSPDGGGVIDFLTAPTIGAQNTTAIPSPTATIALTDGTVTLSVNTTPGFSYQLQFSNDLTSGSWTDIGTMTPATGATLDLMDTPGSETRRFYRALRVP